MTRDIKVTCDGTDRRDPHKERMIASLSLTTELGDGSLDDPWSTAQRWTVDPLPAFSGDRRSPDRLGLRANYVGPSPKRGRVDSATRGRYSKPADTGDGVIVCRSCGDVAVIPADILQRYCSEESQRRVSLSALRDRLAYYLSQ